jgi:hypothetical protein
LNETPESKCGYKLPGGEFGFVRFGRVSDARREISNRRINSTFQGVRKNMRGDLILSSPEEANKIHQFARENPEQILGVQSMVTYAGFWVLYASEILIWLPVLLVATLAVSYLNARKNRGSSKKNKDVYF